MSANRSTRSRDSVVSNPSVTSTVSESAATTQQFPSSANAAPPAAAAPDAPPQPGNPSSSANAVDASVYERLLKDYKRLRSKVEVLEKENEDLRASLWEVSWRSKPHKQQRLLNDLQQDAPQPVPAPPVRVPAEPDFLKLNQGPPMSAGVSSMASSLLPSSASAPSATSSTRDVALNREHAISLPSTRESSEGSTREYRWKRAADLSDHRGAVYSVQWAQDYLASAGMDGIRIWKSSDWSEEAPALSLHLIHHAAPVSSLACSPDAIVSGGFDSTVMLNDLEKGEPTWTKTTEGLVQAVAWTTSSHSDFAWGTTGKHLGLADRRAKHVLGEYQTDAMINTIAPLADEQLLCGLSSGQTRFFDLRAMSFVPAAPPASTAKRSPLSCAATTLKDRLLATTSFDNSVRIYDRSAVEADAQPKLIHTLKTKNRNYPIKCAWYQGMLYNDSKARRRQAARSISTSLVLATGSSDPTVLVYDLSNVLLGGEVGAQKDKPSERPREEGEKEEIKCARLEGHKEAVYAVDFNRTTETPFLASGAGDGVVKIWRVVETD